MCGAKSAWPHMDGRNADFAPHMERSNAEFALHMEGSNADFALHMKQRLNFRVYRIA